MKELEFLRNVWDNIPSVGNKKHSSLIKKHILNVDEFLHTGESMYVLFNTFTEKVEDVSKQIRKILGFDKEEFTMEVFFQNIHPEDLPFIMNYEQTAVDFFKQLNEDHRLSYKFNYDYRFFTKDRNYKRILHEVIPIQFLKEGGAITLIVMTDISNYPIHGIPRLSFIGLNDLPCFYNYHLDTHNKIDTAYSLTYREKEILNLIVTGFKSKEIAEKLHRSIFTINNHRKEILRKMDCKSTNELISKSIREGVVDLTNE